MESPLRRPNGAWRGAMALYDAPRRGQQAIEVPETSGALLGNPMGRFGDFDNDFNVNNIE